MSASQVSILLPWLLGVTVGNWGERSPAVGISCQGLGNLQRNLKRSDNAQLPEAVPVDCEGNEFLQVNIVIYWGKWTTAEGAVRNLRELAVVEVIYSDPDNIQFCEDLYGFQYTRAVWRRPVQNALVLYTSTLVMMDYPHLETLKVKRLPWL